MLVNKNVTLRVELKNDLEISGVLDYVDPNLNLHLSKVSVSDPEKFPHLVCLTVVYHAATPKTACLTLCNC